MREMFDIETVGGMNRAVEWTRNLFECLTEGGVWIVPRSGTMVTVYKSERKAAIKAGATPDPSVEQVIRAMGWKVETDDNDAQQG